MTSAVQPLGEEGAAQILDSLDDPVVRELVRLCLAEARMRFMRPQGMSEAQWQMQLPVSPFDMEFFASVVTKALSRRDVLERILAGESLAQATGWDV